MRRSAIAVMMLAMATSARLAAQIPRVYLTPFGGAYIPTTRLGSVRVLDNNGDPVVVDGKMETSAGGGGRLGWTVGRLGIEGSYYYSKGTLRVTDGQLTALFDAQVQVASLKGTLRVTDDLSGTELVVNGGIGGVHHGGRGFRFDGSTTDIGGVLGGGLFITVGSQVKLRLDSEIFVYRFNAGPGLGSRTQADVLMTAGLALQLSR